MRISIIIGIIALVIVTISFILAFKVFEKNIKLQESFIWVYLVSNSVFSLCILINIPSVYNGIVTACKNFF